MFNSKKKLKDRIYELENQITQLISEKDTNQVYVKSIIEESMKVSAEKENIILQLQRSLRDKEYETKECLMIYAGEIIKNFTKYFSTEDCMTCLLDKDGVFLIYNRSKIVDLKLTGSSIRKESPTYIETLGKGVPTITRVPSNTYGPNTPSFVFFAFPIKYKEEVLGATGITIDMTNNDMLPTIVAGIEEMRAASEELIVCVGNMKERLDMVSQATINSGNRMNNLFESIKILDDIHKNIDDISDNINLLSLNATIEAARAREHGKGFAVIAEAITKVNDKTVNANKQSEEATKNIFKHLEEIKLAYQMLRQVQGDLMLYNDTLSSMYEELSAQIDQLNNAVSSINIGQEL